MIIAACFLIFVVAACICGMLVARNNREKVDTVADKAEAILEVLKK